MKKRGRQLDEKNQKIAVLEKNYSLAKNSKGLWANDQILLHFLEAKPFVAWMKLPTDEPMVDIKGDDDEVP